MWGVFGAWAAVPALACLLGLGGIGSAAHTAALVRASQSLGRKAFVTGTGRCDPATKFCVGIALHVVERDGVPVQTPLWVYRDIAVANRLFSPIDVGFEVVSIEAEHADLAQMETRKDRDLLGRRDFSRGVVHVYVVARLADVDIKGDEIRGVHWRDRADRSRRWIILSAIGSETVLAHELGHFFGLPHSRYDVSIMNKTPRATPTWADRVFADPEQRVMKRHRDRMLKSGMLTLRHAGRRGR